LNLEPETLNLKPLTWNLNVGDGYGNGDGSWRWLMAMVDGFAL